MARSPLCHRRSVPSTPRFSTRSKGDVQGTKPFDPTQVGFAWAGFGAAFGPIVLLSLYWRRLTTWGALAAMVVGPVTVFGWSAASGGLFDLYELLPGFVFALVVAVVVSLATYRRDEEIEEEFTSAVAMASGRGRRRRDGF